MLTNDFKQNIQNPADNSEALNKPMDSEAFKQWAQPAPEKSPYNVAMGKENPDGTPNTEKGVIPQAFDQFKKGYEQTKAGAKNPSLLKGAIDIGKGALNEAAAGIKTAFSPVEAVTKVISKLPAFKQLGEGVDSAVKYVADHIADYKPLQEFMQKNPDAEEVASNVITIAAPLLLSKYVEMRTSLNGLKKSVATSGTEYDAPSEQYPKGGIMQDVSTNMFDKTLKYPFAEHMLSDIKLKMDAFSGMKGLGDEFAKTVDLSQPMTTAQMRSMAADFLTKHEASPGLATLGDMAKSNLDTLGTKVSETFGKGKEAIGKTPTAPVVADSASLLEKSAIRDATPSYNKSLIGEQGIKNPDGTITPRVSEIDSKNPFAMREVASTASEIAAGKELSKVEGYNPKGTSLDKYNTVSDAIVKKSSAYRTSLENEKVVIPKKEMTSLIKKTVNQKSMDSLLLQKTDPIVKNYIRVAERAASEVEGNLKGEDQLRLKLDQAYDDAGGKYGNNKGLDQIHRAARDAITQDMEARAQSTQVKASLKEMSNLYKAADVLKDKAQAEGGSKWEQFKKKYPITTKVGGKILNAAGLGEAVHLAP